jgi:hypothetical protein
VSTFPAVFFRGIVFKMLFIPQFNPRVILSIDKLAIGQAGMIHSGGRSAV